MKWNFLAAKGGRPDVWLDEFAAKQTDAARKDAQVKADTFKPKRPKPAS
jgi:hypothetical protein